MCTFESMHLIVNYPSNVTGLMRRDNTDQQGCRAEAGRASFLGQPIVRGS